MNRAVSGKPQGPRHLDPRGPGRGSRRKCATLATPRVARGLTLELWVERDFTRSVRAFLSYRRVLVTGSVAGTMGVVEWLALGHPVGLVFGLVMGLLALLVAPLPWLWILPWGLKRPLPEVLLRATAVLGLCAVVVLVAYLAFFAGRDLLVPDWRRHAPGNIAHLSAWSSVVISIPLFAAAGWGLSRHSELERRLEVHGERELALRRALDQARLMALQSRLDPHFLFNALNLVAELCTEDPREAERCVVRLGGLLRAALEHGESSLIPLSRELDLCVDYLDLCQARFGDRLQTETHRDPRVERVQIPQFAIQVLCENAVRHGVERTPGGGMVRIEAQATAQQATIQVTSPGPFRGPRKGGLGIELTRRRLTLAFGPAAHLTIGTADDGQSTVARLTVPLQEGGG